MRFLPLALSALVLVAIVAGCGGEAPASPTSAQAAPTSATAVSATTAPAIAASAAPVAASTAEIATPEGPTATASTQGTSAPSKAQASGGQAEWLVMLYQDADDQVLEQDILLDLNESELVGSTDQVKIVSQIDRFDGGYDGMGDWKTTKRFLVTKDSDLGTINSKEVADLGELNMADEATLVDFVAWAAQTYPARKYALIFSDHGSGWPGCCSDDAPVPDAQFDLAHLDHALGQARASAGIDKFEMLGFDACLNGQLEVFSMLAPHGRYAVASEETEPSVGWAYTSFLGQLVANPSMDGAVLSKDIVAGYINQDQRIQNDTARLELAGDATSSAKDVADGMARRVTLAAVDLSRIDAVGKALDDLVVPLANLDPNTVGEARAYTQSFHSVFGKDEPSPYIDLGHFALWLQTNSGDADVAAAADRLLAAEKQALIAETHGQDRPGATGISFFFPVAETYDRYANAYTTLAAAFNGQHQWAAFLANYASAMSASTAAPEAQATEGTEGGDGAQTPEAGGRSAQPKPIKITPLTLSAETTALGKPVNMKTEINGKRLGFVYRFVGRVSPEDDALIVEDLDFVFAGQSKQVGGVQYPDWPAGGVKVDFDWEPIVVAIDDGSTSVRALVAPEEYDETSPTYVTYGTYVFADGTPPRDAELLFRDAELIEVLGFSVNHGLQEVHTITPRPGDKFTVLEQGFTLSGADAGTDISRDSGTLTFGAKPFTIQETPAPAGCYVVGFVAEDLDGRTYEQFETLFVENSGASAVPGFSSYINQSLGFALLYPQTWSANEDASASTVTFDAPSGDAVAIVGQDRYPGLSEAEADQRAVQDLLAGLGSLENLKTGATVDSVLGGFDAKSADVTFTLDGQAYAGRVLAATPIDGTTYGVLVIAPGSGFDAALRDTFDPMLENFDAFVSGVDHQE